MKNNNAKNPWHKLASIIFSPSHEIKQFNEYVDKKICIEEKLQKFPFRNLVMGALIDLRKRQAASLAIKKSKNKTFRQLGTIR